MEWARTVRIDSPPDAKLEGRIARILSHEGVSVRFGGSAGVGRSYALVEGPAGVDAAQLEGRLPDARWYPDAIIVLAIEPQPADALPAIARALGGPGAPAGVCACDVVDRFLVVEFRPSVTAAPLVVGLADVELRRFSGHRRTRLLAPLPTELWARIAADGLQAPEIAESRILESLLGIAHVE